MASRQLPPGHLGNDTRSPIRSNVALRWTSNIVAAPPPPKDARSPVKRWPPVQAQAPVVTTVASKAALQPAVEENATVSAFQSARAVFENRKSLAASPPPPPPIRHRFAFPIEKHHSTTSDLSASSCSTLDSESDRKLEESTAVNYEPEPSSPVRLVVKKMEAEIVDTTLSKQADKAMEPVNSVAPSPVTQVSRENATQSQQTLVRSPSHNEIDPFQLLLPIENIPTLPDEITCVYDKAAIEMEKNIKKVVRKLLRKDKARLEEFKVNSRLFGTDFLDSNAYLNTLIKDFGAIRALQLVPCLLSIQPNLVKSKALLLTAKNYLLRNEDELKHELQLLNSKRITNVNLDKETMPAAGVVRDGSSTEVSSVASRKTTSPTSDVVCSPSGHAASDPTQVDTAFSTTASPVFQPPSLSVVPPLMTLAQRKDDGSTEEVMAKSKVVELTPESQTMPRVETPPPLLSIAVSTPSRISSTTPIMQDYAPTPAPTKYTASEISTKAEEDCKSLFGEINKPITLEKNQKPQQAEIPAAPLSPASSVHSFDEAESLFGERLSPSSRTSRKSVTWGDTQTVEIPDKMTQTAKKPAPLLFGLATAAAFESDDDESDFSD